MLGDLAKVSNERLPVKVLSGQIDCLGVRCNTQKMLAVSENSHLILHCGDVPRIWQAEELWRLHVCTGSARYLRQVPWHTSTSWHCYNNQILYHLPYLPQSYR